MIPSLGQSHIVYLIAQLETGVVVGLGLIVILKAD